MEAVEGFEVTIAMLLENLSICEFYASIYVGVELPSRSTMNSLRLENMLESAIPELYAAVIVFAVKGRTYFEARGTYIVNGTSYRMLILKPNLGMKQIVNMLKPFDIELLPFIEEINAKESVIRGFADAATMERIRGMFLHDIKI